MSINNYAISIDTETTGITDVDIGLTTDGFIRIITGRPGYTGSPTYPKWEDDSDNTDQWFEGILIREEVGDPNRRINIEPTGDYGTLSGFDFTVKNNPKFWDKIQTNGIYLSEKTIRYYVVIDDKFYDGWSGEITNNPYTETDYKFICKDVFKKIHKRVPTVAITETKYPNASEDAKGSALPICIGEIPYVETKNISGNATPVPLLKRSGVLYFSAGCIDYEEFPGGGGVSTLELLAPKADVENEPDPDDPSVTYWGDTTGENAFNYYLRVVRGGDSADADTEQLIQITSDPFGHAGTNLILWLNDKIDGLDDAIPGAYKVGIAFNQFTWFFQVIRVPVLHAISEQPVNEIIKSVYDTPLLNEYSSDKKKYSDISYIVKDELNDFSPATIRTLNSDISTDGALKTFVYYTPTDALKLEDGGFGSALAVIQRDRGVFSTTVLTFPSDSVTYRIKLPDELIQADISKVMILADAQVVSAESIVEDADIEYKFRVARVVDPYGDPGENIYEGGDSAVVFSQSGSDPADYTLTANTILNDYYKLSGGSLGEDSYFGGTSFGGDDLINEKLIVTESALKDIKAGYLSNWLEITFSVTTSTPASLRMREIAIVAEKTIGVIDGSIYPRVQGEFGAGGAIESFSTYFGGARTNAEATAHGLSVGDVIVIKNSINYNGKYSIIEVPDVDNFVIEPDYVAETIVKQVYCKGLSNTVYDAFGLLLQNYDVISADNIDYGNLPMTRSNWYVGRQLTEIKESFNYLKELCQQSFVGLFPSRDGKRKMSAWFDKTDYTEFTHDNDSILRDSIKSFRRIKLENVYNDFELKYSWNPGKSDFDRAFFITKVDEDAFPAVSGNWKEYAGGLNAGSYADAKKAWDICHNAYLRTGNVVKYPANLSKLTWFIDRNIYDDSISIGIGVDSSAYRLLDNLIFWVTNQKYVASYSLPLTADNIVLDLLDYGTFKDFLYTNDTSYRGWVTNIKINSQSDTLSVEAVLLDDLSFEDDFDIEETGSAADTVDESGSRTDTITEGA